MSSPSKSSGGGINFSGTTTVKYDNSGLQQAKADADQLDQKIEISRLKLMTWWNYGMQITNLIFRGLSRAAKGTEAEAGMRVALSLIHTAQAEASVILTQTRATEAFLTGNVIQGVMLEIIVGMLQVSVIQSIALEAQARLAEQQAQQLRSQIDSYRS